MTSKQPSVGPKTTPPPPVSSSSPPNMSTEQLRQELTRVSALLQETDEALDEWVAECERLQKMVQLLEQGMDEMKQEMLTLQEERNYKNNNTSADPTGPLREQLLQAQTWVKDSMAKVEEANKRAQDAVKKAAAGEKALGEAGRLENVRHALELELIDLRTKYRAGIEEVRDARAHVGKLQAISTVLSFQLDVAQNQEAKVNSWLGSILMWGSRL